MQIARRYNPFRRTLAGKSKDKCQSGCADQRQCDCGDNTVKACFSPYIAGARPCYSCPQPACVPKYRKRVLKMSGNVLTTTVKNEQGQITSILYTYNIRLDNCTGYTISKLTLDADIRILECGSERPLVGQGKCSCCFDPKDIDVMVENKSQMCNCKCKCNCKKDERNCVSFDCDGVHIKLFDVAPGKSIVTVVVPLFNEDPEEPFPCKMLPALYTGRVIECLCDEERVVYQNSILVGNQPNDFECEEDSEDSCCSDCSCSDCYD